jgi:excisionase family DNA binding protein
MVVPSGEVDKLRTQMKSSISPIAFIDKLVKKNELGQPFKLIDLQREILRLAFTFDEPGPQKKIVARSSRARKVPHLHDILTTDDVARLFQLNPKTVERLARKGSIPGRQVAKKWRFNRAKLLAYLLKHGSS